MKLWIPFISFVWAFLFGFGLALLRADSWRFPYF